MANYVSNLTVQVGDNSSATYNIRELFPHVGTCSTAAATAAKEVTIGNFKLYTGAWVVVKFNNTNSAAVASLTLNVDGTGAKPIKYRNADLASASQLIANRYTYFIYDGTNYQIVSDFNSDTYDRTSQQTRIYAGTIGVFNYSLCAMDNNQRMQSFTTTSGTGTAKTFNTSASFMYPPVIMYNAANSTYADGTAIANNVLYEQYPSVDLRYSCNVTSTAGFTQYKPVYLECTINSDGTFKLTTTGLTQTFTNGKYYILLGCMYNTSIYQLALFAQHPMFYYDGTHLNGIVYTAAEKTKLSGIANGATKVESSSNGKIKINGTDTTVYSHPTHTAASSGLYKITVDTSGHVSATTAVAKADITALGIPGNDTDTKVTQSATTTTNYRPILFGAKNSTDVSTLADTITDQAYTSTKMFAKPETGYLYASGFSTSSYINGTGAQLAQYGLYLKSYKSASLPAGGDYSYSRYAIRVYDGKSIDNNGMLLTIDGGGLTIVGGGESATSLANLMSDDQRDSNTSRARLNVGGTLNTAFTASNEQLILSSDNNIYFLTNCNTIADRKPVVLDTNSYFHPGTTKTGSIGTSSYMWNSVYAATIYENGTSLASKYAAIGHTHTTTIAADSGTNQLTLAASTKYKLTAGGTNFIFTTPPNTTYSAGNHLTLSGTTFKVADYCKNLNGGDWNTVTTNGWYMGSECANAPSTAWWIGHVHAHNNKYCIQELWNFDVVPPDTAKPDAMFMGHKMRWFRNSAWGPWVDVSTPTPSAKVDCDWDTVASRTTNVTRGWMAYWNGAYNGSTSNLTYCNRGAFGTIVTKSTSDYSKVSFSQNLTSGTKIGSITIDGTSTDLYCQTNTNTDTLVSQTFATADHNRPLLMSYYDTGIETTTAQVVHRNDALFFNPSSGILRSPRLYLQTTGMPITINLDTLQPTAGKNVDVMSVRYKNTDGTATHTVFPIGILGNSATGSGATNNSGVRLGSTNGTTIVGAGESSVTFAAAQAKYNDESLYLVADQAVYMYTNCSNDSTTVTGPWRVGGFTTGTAAITSGRVMITDGTTGGFKASDYTIAKSVPSDAKFSDTVTTVTTSGSGNAVTSITASNGALTVTKGSTFSLSNHTHTTTIAADSGTNQLTLAASTKYKLTAGGTNFIFTTPPNTTYSAGTGLSLSGTTFNHSNSVTAVTTAVFKKITYDAQGHITGTANVTASDLPSHTHGLLDSSFVKAASDASDTGWSILGIDASANGFILKSIRDNTTNTNWMSGDYGAGIVFGGSDTKGVISMKYSSPVITFAGGNHSSTATSPDWYIKITGTSGKTYNFDNYMGAVKIGSYYGMALPDGTDKGNNSWIRTTRLGLIPYAIDTDTTDGNVSTLGTSTWTFAAGYINNLYYKDLKTVTVVAGNTADNSIDKMAGSFFFSGSNLFGGVNDWVGIQAGYSYDKFQLIPNGIMGVLYRQNDAGGTNTTSWNEIKNLMTPEAVSGQNGITVTKRTNTLGTGNTALTYDAGVNIGHSNSVTAKDNYNKKFFTHDAQGHITETSWYIHDASGTNGSNNDTTWIKIATLVHTSTYNNSPITIAFTQRGNTVRNRLTIRFSSDNSKDPSLELFLLTCDALWASSNSRALIVKTATSTWDIYIKKLDTYEIIHVSDFDIGSTGSTKLTWTWQDEQVSTTPANATEATKKVYSTTDHTHSYAGSSSAGGAATSANKLNTNAGGTYLPVYFSGGVPVAVTVKNNTSVGTIGWTSGAAANAALVTVNSIAYWNGAYSGTTSNLAYCKKGEFGSIITKNTSDYYSATTTRTANYVLAGPSSGSAAAATFRKLVADDIPDLSGSYLPLSGGTLTGELTFASFANATADADRPIFFKHNTANKICTNDNFKYNPAKKRLYCTVVSRTLTGGTAVAGQDKGSGVSPRYFPAQWKFNAGLTPADGDTIIIKLPGAGHASGVWLSVNNGTTYYPISNNNKTRLQTQFASGQYIELMFKSDGKTTTYPIAGANTTSDLPSSGGCWVVLNYYDSNSDTKVRQTLASGNSDRPILLSYAETSSSTANVDNVAYRNNYIFANTATGAITAGSFLTITGFTAPVMKRLYSNDSTSSTSITIVKTDIADYEFFVVIVTDSPGSSWESVGTHWIPARTGIHNVMFNNGAAPTATGGYNHLMDGAIQISRVGESGQDLSFLVIRPDKAVSTINSSSVSVDTPPNLRIMRVYGIKAFPTS